MNNDLGIEALKRAIILAGGQVALGNKIGSTQQSISWWLHKSGQVPAEKAPLIEVAVNGQVTREQLRPDIFALSSPDAPTSA